MDFVVSVIKDVLSALYQVFGASVVMAVLFMPVYTRAHKSGWKTVACEWIDGFRADPAFRRVFLLMLYTAMILFRTILCRNVWGNPLDNIIGIWGLHKADGTLYTENIENIILFMPFTYLLLRSGINRISACVKHGLPQIIWKSVWISFLFSFGIELCQLFFKLGTFQLTDLAFNTLGGLCGGIFFVVTDRIRAAVR